MTHYPGFLKAFSKLTKIPEEKFPVLENYITDYYQLGFYSCPYPFILPGKKKKGAQLIQVGGFTKHFSKPVITSSGKFSSVIFLNLWALMEGSTEIDFFPYPKLVLRFNKFVTLFKKFWLHEYLHVLGISDRRIRALRKMKLEV